MTSTQPSPSTSATDPKPFLSNRKIIIAGGGIAGLAFPIALCKQWPEEHASSFPEIKIYERDSPETGLGREGYSISIRGDSLAGGMQALHRMGLLEGLLRESITGREGADKGSFSLWDLDWNPLLQISGVRTDEDLPAPGMRIKRDVLRKGLIKAVREQLGDAVLCWERMCTGVEEPVPGQRVKVQITNTTTGSESSDDCDLLIVADGSRSKIRMQLRPNDSLTFQSVVCIGGTARFEEGSIPEPMDKDWGGVLGGGGTGLFVSPVDTRSALWNLSYYASEPRERMSAPFTNEQVQSLLDEAIERGKPFREPLPTLIKNTDPSTLMVFNAMDKPPFRHDEDTRILFIGDSNHAMSPFAGNGANMALRDAWELAQTLSPVGSEFSQAVKAYDNMSVGRSARAISTSHWSISLLHSTGWKLWSYKVFLRAIRFVMSWSRL